MRRPSKPPTRIVSATLAISGGTAVGGEKPKSRRVTKAEETERLLTYFDETKKQIETQLREQGHPSPVAEAKRIAAADYRVHSVEAMRKKAKRTRKPAGGE
jgi:hypothetical protein